MRVGIPPLMESILLLQTGIPATLPFMKVLEARSVPSPSKVPGNLITSSMLKIPHGLLMENRLFMTGKMRTVVSNCGLSDLTTQSLDYSINQMKR